MESFEGTANMACYDVNLNPMTTSHPKRRFFRYSLRTLMIVVKVFCIWLGIIANRARN